MANIFSGKSFLLVTGASRGIGKNIAETFASLLESNSKILLLARNADNMKKVVDELPKGLITSYKSVDFSATSTNKFQDVIQESLKDEKPENFNQAIIVHGAAGASFSQSTNEMIDYNEWHKFFHLNMFSPAVLNGVFMKTFNNNNTKKYVINISSYWSLKPEIYVGSYCAAKAAKNMFFKVFALENPDVNVLNYLPGFVETDMFYDALKMTKSEELKNKLNEMIEKKNFVAPAQTAKILVEVLKKQKYKSGDHVDYYDQIQ